MTIHAVGPLDPHKAVTAVAKIRLAGMALPEARPGQSDIVGFAVKRGIRPDVSPHHVFAPAQQQLHVGASHVFHRRHALFLAFGKLEIRRLGSPPGREIVGEGKGNHGQKYEQTDEDEASITHGLSRLQVVAWDLRAGRSCGCVHL